MPDTHYPGSPVHQRLLDGIVSYYAADSRVLAVSVFGSLGRGNWDEYSDLDLDLVIADDVQLNVQDELRQLCHSLSELSRQKVLITPDGSDAGDVVTEALIQLSVRYHPLTATSPNIVDSLRVLGGRLNPALIAAAGIANQRAQRDSPETILDRCVRDLVTADVSLQRSQLWGALEMLHRIRGHLMDLFALAHGGARSMPTFEASAPPELQARLGQTLSPYSRLSLQESLAGCLEILEHDLGQLTRGMLGLTDVHRQIIASVRARQAQLARIPE